jgi:hypothetical protein
MTRFIGSIALCRLLLPIRGHAQKAFEQDPSQISREQWQTQVKAAREQSETIRRGRRHLIPQAPTAEELAEDVSCRVLEDDSLRPGDVVSTNRGLFRFQGAPDREQKPDDFVRIR